MTYKLDSNYFTLLSEKTDAMHTYQAYAPINPSSTMILFSKLNGEPLAAISMLPSENTVKSVVTARPPPKGKNDDYQYFQAMVDKADSEFSLVISNLTHFHDDHDQKIGYVNINILHTLMPKGFVDCVDPGAEYAINQVNELRPSQSYKVECDQRNNYSLIIKNVKNELDNTNLSVAASEHKEHVLGKKTDATYLYISVVAENRTTELVNLFRAGTTWKCVQAFVRTLNKKPEAQPIIEQEKQVRITNVKETRKQSPGFSFGNFFSFGGRKDLSREEIPVAELAKGSRGRANKKEIEIEDDVEELMDQEKEVSEEEPEKTTIPDQLPVGYAKKNDESAVKCKKKISAVPVACLQPVPAMGGSMPKPQANKVDVHVDSSDVMKSQAAKLGVGNRYVQVNSGYTGAEYAYDCPSSNCCLGLSIWPSLSINTMPRLALISLSSRLISDCMDNSNMQLVSLLKAVYQSENCVICLEGVPDTIFLPCGHLAVHWKCVSAQPPTECVLCRQFIFGRLQSGILPP